MACILSFCLLGVRAHSIGQEKVGSGKFAWGLWDLCKIAHVLLSHEVRAFHLFVLALLSIPLYVRLCVVLFSIRLADVLDTVKP